MKLRPDPGTDSVTATRLAAATPPHAEPVDVTRIAHSPAADSDATRIARDVSDIESEGTRIRGRVLPTQPDSNTGCELVERYRIGDKIGDRYEVLAIHRGTMGVVYGTFDNLEKLPRALKTLQQRHINDRKMLDLFTEEALTWVRLEKHPFIVRAYLVRTFDAQPYVVTEYIRGQESMGSDLRAWLGHPKLKLPIAVEISLQIAQGMQHAVRKVPGLLHRDLKPANILVDDQARAMITDFGLAHAEEAGAGTPAYMAPEQWRAEHLDLCTDIYAYGCILYEMFTGHRMFAACNEDEWKSAHLSQVPISPMELNDRLPAHISAFILRCLEKEISLRPATWDEVVTECARWFYAATGLPVVLDFSADALSVGELIHAGVSFHNLGRDDDALSAYDRALAIDATAVRAWMGKGSAFLSLKRYDKALATCDHVLGLDPDNRLIWTLKGQILQSLKRFSDALAPYERALSLDPSHGRTWLNCGEALLMLERNQDAFVAYEHAFRLGALPAEGFWFAKGYTLLKANRFEESIAAFDQALSLNKKKAATWSNKGFALYSLNRHEEAVAAYDRALELAPNDQNSLNNRRISLKLLNRHKHERPIKNDAPPPEASRVSVPQTTNTALRKLWPLEQKQIKPRPKSLWARLWGK
jgi:tetratricopeptide (TPR) repeat protein